MRFSLKPRSIFEAILGPDVLNLFHSDPLPPATPPPTLEPAVPIPEPGGAESEAARRASIAKQKKRRGRASTIFTPEGEGLGG